MRLKTLFSKIRGWEHAGAVAQPVGEHEKTEKRRVLNALYGYSSFSSGAVEALTGLSRPTVQKYINELVRAGCLRELDAKPGGDLGVEKLFTVVDWKKLRLEVMS